MKYVIDKQKNTIWIPGRAIAEAQVIEGTRVVNLRGLEEKLVSELDSCTNTEWYFAVEENIKPVVMALLEENQLSGFQQRLKNKGLVLTKPPALDPVTRRHIVAIDLMQAYSVLVFGNRSSVELKPEPASAAVQPPAVSVSVPSLPVPTTRNREEHLSNRVSLRS